ncbi:hypothetical protein BGZ70_010668 [Mortierella alpina]|uniref:Uncharacterized protein n=1 Tax=Mortierella alpina TaxID=64518 RepID=A0A9P6LZH2_MORAP|nr:hypothetical protein BGZ70_010668 [Mortierella alpina]
MAAASFGMGMALKDDLDYPGHLEIILAVDGLDIILYTATIFTSTRVHTRLFRILFRLVMIIMALYGPARALNECKFWVRRIYSYDSRFGPPDPSGAQGKRCIVALTVCVLTVIELVSYWRSDEGTEQAVHEELAAPIDIEMGDAVDQRKMTAAPDPMPVFAIAHYR